MYFALESIYNVSRSTDLAVIVPTFLHLFYCVLSLYFFATKSCFVALGSVSVCTVLYLYHGLALLHSIHNVFFTPPTSSTCCISCESLTSLRVALFPNQPECTSNI